MKEQKQETTTQTPMSLPTVTRRMTRQRQKSATINVKPEKKKEGGRWGRKGEVCYLGRRLKPTSGQKRVNALSLQAERDGKKLAGT